MNERTELGFVILEDNSERRELMRGWLNDRFPQYRIEFFSTAAECIDCLRRRLPFTLAISLDHDLELIPSAGGKLLDPGDGVQVADFLAEQPPACPVLIHSTNSTAALAMSEQLERAGWPIECVTPFGDLEWISEIWFPTLRRALSAWVRSHQPLSTSVE